MPRCFFKLAFCAVLAFVSAACKETKEERKNPDETPASPTKVLDYLSLSAQHLMNQQKPDGFFNYEYDFITGGYTNWDNVIHQTRAGYVLAKYYSFLIRNKIAQPMAAQVKESVVKALRGYEAVSLAHQNIPGRMISFYYNQSGSALLSFDQTQEAAESRKRQRVEAEAVSTAFALMTELTYWDATSDASFASERTAWRDALVFHLKEALKHPSSKNFFQPEIWLALSIYNRLIPDDGETDVLLAQVDNLYTGQYRQIRDTRDYSWDMAAAYIRYQKTKNEYLVNFAVKQTTLLLESIYTQHDPSLNSCSLAYGLADAALLLAKDQKFSRLEKTALGRSQLEYYSSLKHMILPDQTWISLGAGRTLHSQDFKRFAGAYVYGHHMPQTGIELSEMCMLTGMRFSNEDIKELKQP